MCMLRSALEPEGTGHGRANQSGRKALPVTCMHRRTRPHFWHDWHRVEVRGSSVQRSKRPKFRQSTVSTSMRHKIMSQHAVGEPRGKRSTQDEEAVELGALADEQTPRGLCQNLAGNPGHEDEQ